MLDIQEKREGSNLTIALEGWLDAATSPALNSIVEEGLRGVSKLTMDLSLLEYITSAGLRVLLTAQKIMMEQGSMVICGANEEVMEVFEMTGFTDILTIQ